MLSENELCPFKPVSCDWFVGLNFLFLFGLERTSMVMTPELKVRYLVFSIKSLVFVGLLYEESLPGTVLVLNWCSKLSGETRVSCIVWDVQCVIFSVCTDSPSYRHPPQWEVLYLGRKEFVRGGRSIASCLYFVGGVLNLFVSFE